MIYPSQLDERWRGTFLGKSRCTCGRYGCTSTCVCCLTSFYGKYISPDVLIREDIYTHKKAYPKLEEGLILWAKLNEALEKHGIPMKWIWRKYHVESFAELKDIVKHPTKSAILNIAYGKHWVTLLNYDLFRTVVVHDPWLGMKRKIKWTEAIGYSVFDKK